MKNTVGKTIGVAKDSKTHFVTRVYLCPTTNMLPCSEGKIPVV